VHVHALCGSECDPVLACSECGEPLDPRQVRVYPGPGAPPAQYSVYRRERFRAARGYAQAQARLTRHAA
jgi:hypothetical protein